MFLSVTFQTLPFKVEMREAKGGMIMAATEEEREILIWQIVQNSIYKEDYLKEIPIKELERIHKDKVK